MIGKPTAQQKLYTDMVYMQLHAIRQIMHAYTQMVLSSHDEFLTCIRPSSSLRTLSSGVSASIVYLGETCVLAITASRCAASSACRRA